MGWASCRRTLAEQENSLANGHAVESGSAVMAGIYAPAADVVALVRNRARSFVYTTGLPPGSVAAAIAALDFMAENPEYCARPLQKAQRFTDAALGLAPAQSPIVPVIIGSATAAMAASQQLAAAGFLVTAIRPPTVPVGTARLRFTFCAAHSDADIDRLAALVRQNIAGCGMKSFFVTRHRHGCGQNLCNGRHHPRRPATGPRRKRDQAGHERL